MYVCMHACLHCISTLYIKISFFSECMNVYVCMYVCMYCMCVR